VTLRARWVTLRARWVTLRAHYTQAAVEAASLALVDELRAHGSVLPLLVGGVHARERAEQLTAAVAVDERDDACVVFVWPGARDAVGPRL
jgi:hypothetical protein